MEVPPIAMREVLAHEDLGETERGSGGFGSTGGSHVQSAVASEEQLQVFEIS
jgi:hypothetical protein